MIRGCLSALLLLVAGTAPSFAQGARAQTVADPADALPPGFQGKVSYFGNHTGIVTSSLTYSGGPKKDCPRPDHRCPERIGGSLEVTLEFDGEVVRGKFRGTGGLRDSQFVGRRIGATDCQLFDRIDGAVWQGHCGSQLFRGSVLSAANAQVQVELFFQGLGVSVFDYADWYKEQRIAIQRVQRYAVLTTALDGDPDLVTEFEAGVELSSYGWEYEQLRVGGVRPSHKVKKPRGANYDYALESELDLRGGRTGWARGHVKGKVLTCVEYSFSQGQCGRLDRPPPPPTPPRRPPESESLFPEDDGPSGS